MPIHVTCPSCHAKFKVSEKFAGQTGPCPKCKKPIQIPEANQEVVIHAPEDEGAKNAEGVSTLKPLEREEIEASPVGIVLIIAICLVTVAATFFLGRMSGAEPISPWLVGAGALLLGPPIAVAGYGILRDHELEPYRGGPLWLRATICGFVYAILWAVYVYLKGGLLDGEVEMFHLVFIGPALLAAGGVAALATLELDYTSGVIHYGIYLLITCCLRWIAGMPLY